MDEQILVRSCLSQLTPMRVNTAHKIRVGAVTDGGYVMIEEMPPMPVCYSIGIGPDVSWDIEMSTRFGASVFQYDHTVEGPPARGERCTFHKIGLAADDDRPELKRLDTMLRDNGHLDRDDLILKCDIEGAEWAAFKGLETGYFARFDQIVMELHWLDHLHDPDFRQTWVAVIGNLYATHQCYHIHGNNFGEFKVVCGVPVPQVVEVSFARRRGRSFAISDEIYPGPLDLPNRADLPDLFLGSFRF